ncbi:hypothetical protein KC207_14850 [Phycicoccus sp. BSK3Z-2]|uniref:Uncharacterized protein n=1 Tax=Phycicoccus avicenniae TaxID=2828860 RepID=A0A941DCQ5_9MICO|nr:hypothetical protein [Phycicoccus avicenniae]MBR7744572.1 hypothetical protein [Phycicoccus avicenniae]
MSEQDLRPRLDARAARQVTVADVWRAVGIGFSLVWTTVLALVVTFWVRVVFFPRPGDEVALWNDVVLAPVALVAAVLAGWTLVGVWRLLLRRPGGFDPLVVLGAFAIAVALLVWAPGRFIDGLDAAPREGVLALGVLGVVSVAAGMLAQRSWRRAAAVVDPVPPDAWEPADDDVV